MASSVLAILPASGTSEYGKGQVIYWPDSVPNRLYLVVKGTVKISQKLKRQ